MKRLVAVGALVGCGGGGDAPVDGTSAGEDARAVADGAGDSAPKAPVRVLTMNLKTALPSDATSDQRTAMVAALIAAEQPDVVALQEITQSSSLANRGQVLASATGYALAWRQTHQLGIGQEGIGILARGTIDWHADRALPHPELGLLNRAVIGARVTIEGRAIELFATHLTVAGSTSDRADQAAEALAFAHAHHQVGVPAFFAGDLNAKPDELAMKMLRGAASHGGVTGDLVDAWTQAETGDGFTIPSDGPDRRIDYIYALPGSGTATRCKTVLDQPVHGVRASDHLGVICTFE
jgi:endonuclease/exonuclease/phosphatase family metal-dependent hydrolase